MATNLKNTKTQSPICRSVKLLLLAVFVSGMALIFLLQPGLAANLMVPETWIGNPIAVPECREYLIELYNDMGMIVNGVGDDQGQRLGSATVRQAVKVQAGQRLDDKWQESQKSLVFYSTAIGCPSNYTGGSLFAERDGHLTLTPGDVLLFAVTPQGKLYANNTLLLQYQQTPLQNRAVVGSFPLVLALKGDAQGEDMPFNEYRDQARVWQRCAWLFAVLAVGALGCILALLWGRKRCPRDGGAAFFALTGRVPIECKLAALALDGLLLFNLASSRMMRSEEVTVLLALPGLLVLYLLLADGWGSRKTHWNNSLTHRAVTGVRSCAAAFDKKLPWQRRAVLFSAAAVILLPVVGAVGGLLVAVLYYGGSLAMMLVGLVVLLAGLCYWALSIKTTLALVREAPALENRILALQKGDITAEDSPLDAASFKLMPAGAAALNSLEDGMAAAVERQLRAEKMKVELVSNVSHDLKTPLTSIINYTDLLCGEELPPAAADYAKVLQKKAYQLKGVHP